MAKAKETKAEALTRLAYEHARASMGDAWNMVGEEIHRGLTCAALLDSLAGQDESISTEKRCKLLIEAHAALQRYF